MERHPRDLMPIGALLLLGSLAFVHLLALPAFEDEGSQLRWIMRVIQAGEWLQPLGDGKPLEAWPMVPLVRLGLPPLMAMRAVHVLAGLLAVLLTHRLALEFGDRGAAFASAALLAICPFLVYLQRLALSDVFMCAAGVWVLLAVLRFVRAPSRSHAVQYACGTVLAAMCKFPVGFVFLIAMPLALVFTRADVRRRVLRAPALPRLLAAHAPIALLILLITVTVILRVRQGLTPGFGLQDFMGIGLGRYRDIAATIGIPHVSLAVELTTQLSWPATLLAVTGLTVGAVSGDWRQRWLMAVGLVPLLAIGLLAAFWFPRYLLFTIPPLTIAAVSGWRSIATHAGRLRRPLEWSVLALCAGLMVRQDVPIIMNPAAARWSPLDRFQYFEGWTSGYGYPEAAQFLLRTADAPSVIYSLDGHSAYQLLSYLPAQWRGRVRPVFYDHEGAELRDVDARFDNLVSRMPVWMIVPESLLAGYMQSSFGSTNCARIDLHPIAQFDKPGRRTRLGLYEVTRRSL